MRNNTVPIPKGATFGEATAPMSSPSAAAPNLSTSAAPPPSTVPIPQGAIIEGDGMEVHNDGSFTLTPKDGESFADTMKRAAQAGQGVTQEQVDSQTQKGLKQVPVVLAAAPAIGAAGAASLAVPGELAGLVGGGTAATKVPAGRDPATGRMLPWLEKGGAEP